MIRPSANSSSGLGNVGYGIAESKSTAQTYAIKRLIECQNNSIYLYNCKTVGCKMDNGYAGIFNAAQMPEAVEILSKES